MPDARVPGELSVREHKERIRRWVQHLWEPLKLAGRDKKDLAETLGFSKTTVTNYINERELPGLECFVRLHFRQGLDPLRMLREDPPKVARSPTRTHTLPQLSAQKKRAARR
jgi:hypothetical protein